MTNREWLAQEKRELRIAKKEMRLAEVELKKVLNEMHIKYSFSERLPKLKLQMELEVDGDEDCFGVCYKGDRIIIINYTLAKEWDMNLIEILEHEYAHYLTSDYDTEMHGPLWKMTCDYIGHDYSKHGYKKEVIIWNS